MIQQQAIRDHRQAMAGYFNGTHRRPTWRKAERDEGFRIVHLKPGDVRRFNRSTGAVHVPKAGWIRFRWSRQISPGVKSFRVTCDRAGRWHVAFAAIPEAVPEAVPAPNNSKVVGIDRGVAVSVALSTGEMLIVPRLSVAETARMLRLQRRLARARLGSNRRRKMKTAVARLKAREKDRRKDWCEKVSTDIARRFDIVRVEDLRVGAMTHSALGKASLNRGILGSGWGLIVRRLEDKAPGRIEKINPAFTSQRCSACGHVAAESRKSQALFRCAACTFACNADVNAARNIAAGHAVTARGRSPAGERVNREPQSVCLPSV